MSKYVIDFGEGWTIDFKTKDEVITYLMNLYSGGEEYIKLTFPNKDYIIFEGNREGFE